ncbi:putative redox protein [Flavobacterium sp. 270]|uniref:OsmC family protein n=1 Tax=Flavobacterium sp. 270 TaxID=2512114 RepID=UPI00106711E2|nr:OsmC family protein [Flavobacterium sp. 270]TDW51769.1 putative redox protein [Flavobacterium sp. 270]
MENTAINSMDCVCASIGKEKYKMLIQSDGHSVLADESVTNGGKDLGMTPQSFLLASLASCTVYLLRAFADNRNWPLDGAEVRVIMTKGKSHNAISMKKEIALHGALSKEQKKRLLQAASESTVHNLLTGDIFISTELSD